jgi:site-specific recombinase XerD
MESVNRRYLTEAQQALLLGTLKQFAAVQARRDRAWIRLMLNTGCRVGEFSNICVKQARLALTTGWLFIPKEHRKGWNRKPRKNSKGESYIPRPPNDHQIPVTDPVREDLRTLLKIQIEMGGAGHDDDPLILSRKHRGMSIRSFQDRFEHWCALCGIEASPHWLRHTRAMNIMRRSSSNDPRGIVQGALGHADISSSGIYTRMSKEDLAQQLAQVDGERRVPKAKVRGLYEGRV